MSSRSRMGLHGACIESSLARTCKKCCGERRGEHLEKTSTVHGTLNRVSRLLCMYYNFCRVHQTLRVTPVIESGIADHVWSIEDWSDCSGYVCRAPQSQVRYMN